MAASEVVAAATHRHPLLPEPGAARRGRAVRFDLPRRPARARRRYRARGPKLARADHGAGGARHRHQQGRADRHRVDHLHRAVQPGAPVRLDRPYERRACGLEYRDLVARRGRAQLRWRQPGDPRRPLRARRGVRACRQGAVGQLGRRCGARRSRGRTVCPRRSHPPDQPRGRALQGRRAAQHAAQPTGPAGVRAGRIVRHRPPLRRAPCRGGVHRADGEGDGAGISMPT